MDGSREREIQNRTELEDVSRTDGWSVASKMVQMMPTQLEWKLGLSLTPESEVKRISSAKWQP